MIKLEIKDDAKINEVNDNILLSVQNSKNWKNRSTINEVFENDKYWLNLAGLSDSSKPGESLRKRMSLTTRHSSSNAKEKSVLKAHALYSFRAQSDKELSFDETDTIVLLREVDRNWYEGECHGRIGLIPSNYVQISGENKDNTNNWPVEIVNDKLAILKHSFNARSSTELSLKKGDIVTLIRQIDSNWFEGEYGGRCGLLPVSYVDRFSKLNLQENSAMNYSDSPESISSADSSCLSIDPALMSLPQSPYNTLPLLFSNDQNKLNSFVNFKANPNCNPTEYITRDILRDHDDNMDTMMDDNIKSNIQTSYSKFHEPWYQAVYSYSPQHTDELSLEEGDLVYMMAKCDDGWWVGRSDRTKKIGTFPGNYVKQIG
jgi:sorbin and SH3 domain-containing protein 1